MYSTLVLRSYSTSIQIPTSPRYQPQIKKRRQDQGYDEISLTGH
jgi:hypothetical protein